MDLCLMIPIFLVVFFTSAEFKALFDEMDETPMEV